MPPVGRRTVLKLASGSVAWAALPWPNGATAAGKGAAADKRAQAQGGGLSIGFDRSLRTCIAFRDQALTPYQASESLLVEGGALEEFEFAAQRVESLRDPLHGAGHRHIVSGRSDTGIEKQVELSFYERYPGMALLQVRYRNTGSTALAVRGWRNAAHELADAPGGFWSFFGATHEDRRDWVQALGDGFDQRNTLSMAASDYGGGTPVANIWRRDIGLAVGHVEAQPRLLDLPVRKTAAGASIGVECRQDLQLAPGQTLTTDRSMLCVHNGDHYAPLLHYQRFMRDQRIAAPAAPESAFAPIWCAWGYEREFTTEQVLGTLPKVRELGFEWAVLDDGWQTNEGDWRIDTRKFPRGEDDMRAFVQAIKAQGLRPRLWLAPLAADPGSDVLHDRPDMLLLDREGSVQKVSWWNAFTQCPAYQPTVDYYVALIQKVIGDWGFEGVKLDGQHLNAVAPCYNPAHKHAHPKESCEKLADFWLAIHRAAHQINPQAVVELCPCGTAFAFHNLPATDQYPSSDPLSSWQVRSKGKTVKALIGRGSSYAGDHVELSDGGDDFASSVGIGAVISSKFTWPRDSDRPMLQPPPPGGYVLTDRKEALWRRWVDLYKQHMLPKGDYLGALYDIGFDKPEAHAIAKDGAMYYAFYADTWSGPLQLRGLGKARYRVHDLFNDIELGRVDARDNVLEAKFERFLLLRATPVAEPA
ncbi:MULTISPECIES: glycoside hydrolase family 36 protein [unclassified Lysobacter]|uniref:glycoside hydrolase family 36 protein n=1 Tax=unclassified Lysobacter TaxID=2635362 RepID=UPI001BE80A11|nr:MULTISPECIES: glycoside hydrolase family 36 protein [unclassified Lysobacter]MBT2744798.1 alpha-galactosidase [Lysobacter sp. ISL-42]MBT2752209.1 alpha-galactosidase [Lysobacter sp. ISL-50]MBT2778706.1 alpha-galactosidase [Lysobacter sp. ISL-54]MBT2780363.1 alpha-galactosidase [Lysobacter sp. ISL-52]